MASYPALTFEVNFTDDPIASHADTVASLVPVGGFGSYWRLDETSGTTANDISWGLDGTYTGGYTLNQAGATGDGNASVSLNGSTGYVAVGNYYEAFNGAFANWTAAAWIYPTATRAGSPGTFAGIINTEYTTSHIPVALAYGQEDSLGVPANRVWGGYYVNPTGWMSIYDPEPAPLNRWTHYTITQYAVENLIVLYRNGVEVARRITTVAAALSTGTPELWIGKWAAASVASHFFPGRIDEVFFCNTPLVASQVATLFASGVVRTPAQKDGGYTDLSSRVRSFSVRRGRSNSTDRIEAGEATVTLDNTDSKLSPDPIVNLVTNPSFELAAGSWATTNAAVTQDSAQQHTGSHSGKITSAATGAVSVYITPESGNTGFLTGLRPGEQYTFSAYVRRPSASGPTLSTVLLFITDSTGSTTSSAPGSSDTWTRLTVTRTIGTAATYARVGLQYTATAGSQYVNIDAMQLERAASVTAYCDGEQSGCRWNNEPHDSVSHRPISGGYANVLPLRMGRLTATWNSIDYPLFDGFVTRYQYGYPAFGKDSVVTMTLVDGFLPLAQQDLVAFVAPTEPSDLRIQRTLLRAGIPTSKHDLAATVSDANVLAISYSQLAGTSPLAHIQDTASSDGGLFFCAADGSYTLQQKDARKPEDAPDVDLSDTDVGDVPYSDLQVGYDDSNIYNEYRYTTAAGSAYLSPASVRRYWPRLGTLSSTLIGQVYLEPRYEARPRAEAIVVKPASRPTDLWPLMLGLEISDKLRIERSVQSNPVLEGYDEYVEGVEHDANPNEWVMRIPTSPALTSMGSPPAAVLLGVADPRALTTGLNVADQTTYSIASAAYTAGRLYVCVVSQGHLTAAITGAPTLSGAGWAQERTDSYDVSGTVWMRHTWFWRVAASDVTEATTITNNGGQTIDQCSWTVMEIDYGFLVADPLGVSNSNQGGSQSSGSVDVGALINAKSVVLAVATFGPSGPSQARTWPSFVELSDQTDAYAGHGTAYGPAGIDTAVCSWPPITGWEMSGVEIKAQ